MGQRLTSKMAEPFQGITMTTSITSWKTNQTQSKSDDLDFQALESEFERLAKLATAIMERIQRDGYAIDPADDEETNILNQHGKSEITEEVGASGGHLDVNVEFKFNTRNRANIMQLLMAAMPSDPTRVACQIDQHGHGLTEHVVKELLHHSRSLGDMARESLYYLDGFHKRLQRCRVLESRAMLLLDQTIGMEIDINKENIRDFSFLQSSWEKASSMTQKLRQRVVDFVVDFRSACDKLPTHCKAMQMATKRLVDETMNGFKKSEWTTMMSVCSDISQKQAEGVTHWGSQLADVLIRYSTQEKLQLEGIEKLQFEGIEKLLLDGIVDRIMRVVKGVDNAEKFWVQKLADIQKTKKLTDMLKSGTIPLEEEFLEKISFLSKGAELEEGLREQLMGARIKSGRPRSNGDPIEGRTKEAGTSTGMEKNEGNNGEVDRYDEKTPGNNTTTTTTVKETNDRGNSDGTGSDAKSSRKKDKKPKRKAKRLKWQDRPMRKNVASKNGGSIVETNDQNDNDQDVIDNDNNDDNINNENSNSSNSYMDKNNLKPKVCCANAVCGREASSSKSLLICGRCRDKKSQPRSFYCGEDCSAADWEARHREFHLIEKAERRRQRRERKEQSQEEQKEKDGGEMVEQKETDERERGMGNGKAAEGVKQVEVDGKHDMVGDRNLPEDEASEEVYDMYGVD